jgi:hypothetical protein
MITGKVRNIGQLDSSIGFGLLLLWIEDDPVRKNKFIACIEKARQTLDFDEFVTHLNTASLNCVDDFQVLFPELDMSDATMQTIMNLIQEQYVN